MPHHPVMGAWRGEVLVDASPGWRDLAADLPAPSTPSLHTWGEIYQMHFCAGCTTGHSWGVTCCSPHPRHPRVLPQACQRRASDATSPLQTFCPLTSLPSLVRFKTRFWKHVSGFLHPVLLMFTVLCTWKSLSCPLCGNHAQTKIPPLFLSFFSSTDFPYLATEVLTPGWKISYPTNYPINTFICNIWKKLLYFIWHMCTYACISWCLCGSEDSWGGKFPPSKWVLGTEFKWSGLEPRPFMHTVISVTFHSTLHAEVSGNALQHQMFWRARQYRSGIFCSPAS